MLSFRCNPMRILPITFLAAAAVFSGCLNRKDADHAKARSTPPQPVEAPFALPQVVAPSIYGHPVVVTDHDSERPLDISIIPARVAIRVASSVHVPMESPSLPTSPLPRAVHRPEFLIDGHVQSLPE